jgi:CHAD domain-containing protein
MAFELKPQGSVAKNIRRIARKQMDKALEQRTGTSRKHQDEAVHEARKCFKKIRAVLRLVRPVIWESCYREENTHFRDAGRPLTEVRDAAIFIETLDHLADHFKEQVAGRTFDHVRRTLEQNLRDVRKRVLEEQHALAVVAKAVRQARGRVKSWAAVPTKWAALGRGLRATHCRAEDAYRAAAADPTLEKLHEWRKQAKYFRYQLEILRPLWPERMKELAGEADCVSELLGDDHDLAMLRQKLTDEPDRFSQEGNQELLLALIDRRRAELQQEALLLGQRFHQESPREFGRRIRSYWRVWRKQDESSQDQMQRLATV